jgi:NitT/TauT family transport system permease protein
MTAQAAMKTEPGGDAPSGVDAAAELAPAPSLRAVFTEPPAGGPSADDLKAMQRWKLRRRRDTALSLFLWAVSLSALFAFWYFGTKYRWDFYIRFLNIPAPAEVYEKLLHVNKSDKFLTNVGISVRRILAGFGVAVLVGIPLGLLIGRYRRVRDLLLPMIEVMRPIPAIAWVPMSIMLWPTNEVSIVFITFLGSFFPILLNTVHGVRTFDPVLLRAARCLGAGEARLFWHVILPGALPQIFTGLAVGMGWRGCR